MRRLLLLVLAVLLVLASAAPATASTRTDIFRDCEDDGQLSGSYSPSELRDARQNLTDDLREYSDCEDVLRRAEVPDRPAPTPDASGGGGPSGGDTSGTSGGSAPAPAPAATPPPPTAPETPQDQEAVNRAQNAGQQPLSVDKRDRTVIPVASGADGARSSGDLPAVLIVALILLGLAGIALSIPPLRRRFDLPFLPKRT